MNDAQVALKQLKDGNLRYLNSYQDKSIKSSPELRNELAAGQNPFAIILGCSDSRVPAELVFDQGLGDLFVIRVAGNIVAPSQIASVEFAVANFGTPLVVVLGHSQCGAVKATIDLFKNPKPFEEKDTNLNSIVNRISPCIADVLEQKAVTCEHDLLEKAIRANVISSVKKLVEGSSILQKALDDKQVAIIGAEYSLETGEVSFIED